LSNPQWQIVDSVRYFRNGSPYPSAFYFQAIDCYDKDNCAAIGNLYGNYPWNRITTNGGLTWETTLRDTSKFNSDSSYYYPAPANAIAYPSKNLCIIACDSGFYWRSVDYCQKWIRGRIFTKGNYSLNKICFFDDKMGAVIDYEELFLTTNGGIDWDKAKIYYPDSILPIFVLDVNIINEDLIYLSTQCYNNNKNRIYFSYDFGKSWDYFEPDLPLFYKMNFINENIGWGLAAKRNDTINYNYRNFIYFTEDGCKTWTKQLDTLTFPNALPLIDIRFSDSLNGIAFGHWYKIWRTTDGGKHWIFDEDYKKRPTKDYLIDISLIKPDLFFGVTAVESGYIYKYQNTTFVEEYSARNENEFNISLSPNPAKDFLEISYSPSIDRRVNPTVDGIAIFNVFGEKVLSTSPQPSPFLEREEPPRLTSSATPQEGNLLLDVSGLPPGVYFVKVGEKVGKFVKM